MTRFVILACALMLLALPATAGNVNLSNGKGLWQSTMCQRPVPPVFVGLSSDAPAGTMNAATGSYNLFVKQTQDYLACLSAEGKADSDASSSLITANVNRQMQKAQEDVKRAQAQLFGPTPVAQPQPVVAHTSSDTAQAPEMRPKPMPASAQVQGAPEPLFQPAEQ